MNLCKHCGNDVGDHNPPGPQHCNECPPWKCETCGEMSSNDDLCSCWIDLTNLALADVKALFAECDDELSVDVELK